jgi:hypothetical protein
MKVRGELEGRPGFAASGQIAGFTPKAKEG